MKRAGRERRFNEFVRRLYALQDMPALRQTIASELLGLIAGDNTAVCETLVEKEPLILACTITHSFSSNLFPEVFCQNLPELPVYHWLVDRHHHGAHAFSEALSRTKLHRTTVYNEAFRPEGVEDALGVEIGRPGKTLIGIGIFRGSRRHYDEDFRVFNALIPHLEQAVGNARRMEELGQPHSLISGLEAGLDAGLILLDREGKLIHWTDRTRRTVQEYFVSERHGQRLPLELARWIRQNINSRRRGIASPMWHRERDGYALELNLVEEPDSERHLLVVRERKAPPSLAGFGLTPRESEILHWIAEGKTNEEIAIILNLSFFTVKNHLKSIFQRLGVETRTAAAAMFMRERETPG